MLEFQDSSKDIDSHLQDLRMLAKSSEDERDLRHLSRVFKALGEEKRLRILTLLDEREMCVCEIMAALKITQPTASHHLGILERAGLVKERREARWVFYSIASPVIIEILDRADEV